MNIGIERAQNRYEIKRIISGRGYPEGHRFFLQRLNRLLVLKEEHLLNQSQEQEEMEFKKKLLNKAIYSTLVDCFEQCLRDDARSILYFKEPLRKELR